MRSCKDSSTAVAGLQSIVSGGGDLVKIMRFWQYARLCNLKQFSVDLESSFIKLEDENKQEIALHFPATGLYIFNAGFESALKKLEKDNE